MRKVKGEPVTLKHNSRIIGIGIIIVGLLHALMYALVMPPWGLLDESQHYHYIQIISEQHRLPVMWRDQLPPEVIDSIFTVKRYVTLGSNTMPTRADFFNHFDSNSYEALHPPLYYASFALVYPFGPTDVLSKLFSLRIVGVFLSALTLMVVWKSCRMLWPEQTWIAVVATLFVALHPERAVSAAQLNNDVLLEIMCAIAFGVLAVAMAKGVTWRLTLMVTMSLVLALLTKLSALIIVPAIVLGWIIAGVIHRQSWQVTIKQILVIAGFVAACLVPITGRNLILYQEPTGLGAFIGRIGPLADTLSSELIVNGILDLFRNSWVILWDGAAVVSKPSAALMQVALIGLMGILVIVVIRAWQEQDRQLTFTARGIIVTSCFAILLISAVTLHSYVRGLIPVVQGRFLLPVVVPTAWLIGFSLWLVGIQWRNLLAIVLLALETFLSLSVLFFHSLPKFYAPRNTGFLGYWQQTVYLFVNPSGMFWDKPDFVNVWTVGLLIAAFCGTTIFIAILFFVQYGNPIHKNQLITITNLIKSYQLPPSKSQDNKQTDITWATRLRRIGQDPLFWITCILLIVYLGWISLYPVNIFWSLDEGGKFIHIQSIIESGNPGTPLMYPGRNLDPKLRFLPLHFWSQSSDQIYSWWPIGFQLMTTPFYILFGWFGLYLLPAIAGAFIALFSGLLVRYLFRQTLWLGAGAAVITGLATPVAFYSTTFWEHTPSVACFLGGVLLILHAWKTGQGRWIVIAGIVLALATYLRTGTIAMVVGIGLVLTIFYWRWSILLGASYVLASLLWLLSNWFLMGHFLGRSWLPGTVSLSSSPLFRGFQDAGIWFIPYALFNSPRVAAFDLGPNILAVGTLLILLILVCPFLYRLKWIALIGYAGLIVICGWVLFQSEGYRSVHGFILVAPHLTFGIWLYKFQSTWRRSLFPVLLLGITATYAIAYLFRAWVPAGGLQWGPRYLLAFYPLFVSASVGGLAIGWTALNQAMKYGLLFLYIAGVLVGFGFQARGVYAALETRRYYQQTEQAIRELKTETIVTHCTWLAMVMPNLYQTGTVFTISDNTSFEDWVAEARRVGVQSVCRLEMDLCSVTPLDEITVQRTVNPSGIETECFAE